MHACGTECCRLLHPDQLVNVKKKKKKTRQDDAFLALQTNLTALYRKRKQLRSFANNEPTNKQQRFFGNRSDNYMR